jgi:CMP-N-acetylneuraminic acid synthetase
MAPRKSQNHSLEQAMAMLIQNQAAFVSRLAETNRRSDERFSRIEEEQKQIKAILLRHEQMLQALPKAVRQKTGFKRQSLPLLLSSSRYSTGGGSF